MGRRSVCWNITSKCNENCKFCYRILTEKEMSLEQNKKILELLMKLSVNKISWTGGEATLYPNLFDLLKMAKVNGITNNLLTNGKGLLEKDIVELQPYLDYITLSYDSNNNETCKIMGRGEKHNVNIIRILDFIKKNNIDIKVKINTLVSKVNKNEIIEIGKILNNYKIERWRLFKFIPLRNYAIENNSIFEIEDEEFDSIFLQIKKIYGKKIKISERKEDKIQKDYLLINSNGDFIITENMMDKKIYNIKENNYEILKEYL